MKLYRILKEPELFGEVFNGMRSDNPLIRMRSTDVIEKVSRIHPEYLTSYKEEIIKEISEMSNRK